MIRKLTEEEIKMMHQLFIGKISDIIGFEKTLEILRECREVVVEAHKKTNK